MRTRARSDAGFSRLDLLGLGAAATVLALVTSPLIAGGSPQARLTLCLDNLRQLSIGISLYAADQEWYPPNPGDANTADFRNWCPGSAGWGMTHEYDLDILRDPRKSLLLDYLECGTEVFRCPADSRLPGRYQGTNPQLQGTRVPVARSVSLNAAVGTNPYVKRGKQAVDAGWLYQDHTHIYGKRWRTYGKPEQVIAPGPGQLFTLMDEDERMISDAAFDFDMQVEEWLDFPATRHDTAGTVAFADGHVQVRRWQDVRTVVGISYARRPAPGSPDVQWLRERTSAEIPK